METNDWNDAERRVERAQELFEQRRWQEALEELRAATSINPYNGGWFFNIGLTLDEMGRLDEAIEAYRQALEIDANDLQALDHLGIDLHRIGHFEHALVPLKRSSRSSRPSSRPTATASSPTARLGDHERAEEMFYLARLYKEHCPHCYYNIGCSLERPAVSTTRRSTAGRRRLIFDEILPRRADPHRGGARGERANWKRPGSITCSALRQDPGDIDTLLDLGELLIRNGPDGEAGEKFRRAIELAPEDPAGHFWHGQWLLRCNNERRSDRRLRSARLVLDPTFAGAHLRLGEPITSADVERLRRHLRAELLLRPQDPQVLLELANLLLDTGQIRRRRRMPASGWSHLDADNISAWQNLAVAQFTARYGEGIAACQEALRQDPHNLMAAYNLALALGQLRQYDEAVACVHAALEIEPRHPRLQNLELHLRILRWQWKLLSGVRRLLRFGR